MGLHSLGGLVHERGQTAPAAIRRGNRADSSARDRPGSKQNRSWNRWGRGGAGPQWEERWSADQASTAQAGGSRRRAAGGSDFGRGRPCRRPALARVAAAAAARRPPPVVRGEVLRRHRGEIARGDVPARRRRGCFLRPRPRPAPELSSDHGFPSSWPSTVSGSCSGAWPLCTSPSTYPGFAGRSSTNLLSGLRNDNERLAGIAHLHARFATILRGNRATTKTTSMEQKPLNDTRPVFTRPLPTPLLRRGYYGYTAGLIMPDSEDSRGIAWNSECISFLCVEGRYRT